MENNQTLLIYTDGSCRPNPGFAGWGFHGYMFDETPPKKGSGNPTHVLTNIGYVDKTIVEATKRDKPNMRIIAPIHYVDGLGSIPGDRRTNNVGELEAAIRAFRHALEYPISNLIIKADSEYVIKGYEKGLPVWPQNQWIARTTGTEVANVEQWKQLLDLSQRLKSRGVKIQFEWVKGHQDPFGHVDALGNNIADHISVIGKNISKAQHDKTFLTVSAPDGYWSVKETRNPLLSQRRLFFNTQAEYNFPGIYYLGNVDKMVGLLGKKISDCSYSVIRLTEPDPHIEMLRQRQCLESQNVDQIVMGYLDNLYRPGVYQDILNYGQYAIERTKHSHKQDLQAVNETLLSEVINPPRLSMIAVNAITDIMRWTDEFLSGSQFYRATDLTSILYETVTKVTKKKEETVKKLKDIYDVGYSALKVTATYPTTTEDIQLDTTLTLGIDLPDRNTLKKLETSIDKVTLVSWQVDDTTFRYFTVVQAGGDIGSWCGIYSNTRFLFEKTPKTKKQSSS